MTDELLKGTKTWKDNICIMQFDIVLFEQTSKHPFIPQF